MKSFVKVAPNAKKLVANNLNAALQKAGLKNVQANVVGTTIFLEGSVESQQDLQKAELITKAIGEKVENLLSVGIKRMVLSEVQIVEIRRSNTDHIGVGWPTDLSGLASPQLTHRQRGLPPGPRPHHGPVVPPDPPARQSRSTSSWVQRWLCAPPRPAQAGLRLG